MDNTLAWCGMCRNVARGGRVLQFGAGGREVPQGEDRGLHVVATGSGSDGARRRLEGLVRGTPGSPVSRLRLGIALGLAVLGLLAVAGSGSALLSLDAITVDTGTTTVTSLDFSHDTPNGSKRLLLVSASWDDSNEVTFNDVTYNGTSLTCLDAARNKGSVGSQMCYMTAPPTGNHTVSVSWGADVLEWVVVARSITDVDQNNPLGSTTVANGTSKTATDAITTSYPDSTIFVHAGAVDEGVSLDPAYQTDEDAEDSAGTLGTGISAAAGRVNTTTTGTYDSGFNISSSKDWALDPAEVRRDPPKISFSQTSSSGDESNSPSISIDMDRSSSADVSIDYTISGGNATSDDHNLSSGTLTFSAGSTSETLSVDVTDDNSDEPDETLELKLENPTGADSMVTGPKKHTYTINDDDSNHAPNPSDASVSTDEDTDLSDSVSASDQDQNDTVDSYSLDDSADHGSVSLDSSTGDYTYTPDADYNGEDSFTFTATDNHGATSANATVNITVNAVNDAPSASDDSGTTDEDTDVYVDVTGDDSDVDGDSLSVDSATTPSDGSTSVPGNGTVRYTPDDDFDGSDSFDYTVSDGNGNTATATVNVTVNPVNDAPSASDDAANTSKSTTVWVDVTANDADVDGDSLSVSSTSTTLDGSTSIPGNGTVEFQPNSNFEGTATFDYTVSDGSLTASATVNVTVGSPPEIVDSSVRVLNDTLSSDPTLNANVFGQAIWLQLENTSSGIDLADLGANTSTRFEVNLTLANFTPRMLMGRASVESWTNTTNANGTENVTFEFEPLQMAFIDDCDTYSGFMGYCGPGSVSNWPTDAAEDVADVNFDAAVRVFLSDLGSMNASRQEDLAGGYMTTDAQALGPMNVSTSGTPSLTMPVAGPHTLPNGSTNDDGYFDARIPDALLDTWGISDTSALSGTYQGSNKTVTVTDLDGYVQLTMDIHYSTGNVTIGEDTTDPVADAGSDQTVGVDDTVQFDGSNSSDNQEVTNYNWTFDDGNDGTGKTTTHTYTSAGTYNVTLNVSDGNGNTDTDTVNITVQSNSAPNASDDSATVDEDAAVYVDVLGDDSDPDGDSLTVSSATSPSDGSTSVPGNGTVKYTPDADWNGDDSFDYDVSDGIDTSTATVNVTVNAVNDAPSPSDDDGSTDENVTVWVDVLGDDSDPDGDSLSVSSVATPSDGTASVPGNGTVEYTPDSGFTGDDAFDYTASDGSLTANATLTITVTSPNNGAPSASDDSATLDEDATTWIDVTSNDSDPDGDSLSVSSVTDPSFGTTSVPGNGTVKFTPDADWNGDGSFDYDVSDGSVSDTGTVSVTVNAVDDAPSASDDSGATSEDTTVWIDVVGNDADVDGDALSVDSVTQPSNGVASMPGNGTVEYTPSSGFTGQDNFTYDVSDGSLTDTATVSVNVSSGGGNNGGPGSVEIVDTSVQAKDGSLSGDPTVNTTSFGSSLNIQLENDTGGIDLDTYGASNDTTLEVNLTVKNFTPTILMGRAQVVDWTNSTNDNGTENVSFELHPISMAFIDDCQTYNASMGYCGPSSPSAWPTNASEDQADVSFDAALRFFVSDLSYMNQSMQDALQGGYITTDAQALGAMNVTGSDSPGGASISIPVAGPHTLPNGTNNTGFFEARIPDALMSWWGIDDPSALTGEYQGADRKVTISNVSKGTKFRMDIHYSSGDVNITEDTTDPVADAGSDMTVTEGNSVSFNASGSSDNQGVTNYNWTFDDGANGTGETTTHTYSATGTYSVTLNVSDGNGNTDTDTVNVSVESAASGGGGGGGGSYADISLASADLAATTAEPGENVTLEATLENDGYGDGSYTITCWAGDIIVGSDTVEVAGDETEIAEIPVSLDDPGTYEITADGVSAGELTVAHPDPTVQGVALAGDEPAPNRTVEVEVRNPAPVDQTADLALRLGAAGSDLPLLLDARTVAEAAVTVPAEETETVAFEGAAAEPGTYVVHLADSDVGAVTVDDADLSSEDEPASTTTVGADAVHEGATLDQARDADAEPDATGPQGRSSYRPASAMPAPGALGALASGLLAAAGLRWRR